MDLKTKLAGLRTALKMSVNVLERMESDSSDFVVGCKCSSADKAKYVYGILKNNLSVLEYESLEVKIVDEIIVEVKLSPKNVVVPLLYAKIVECDNESVSQEHLGDKEHHDNEKMSLEESSGLASDIEKISLDSL